MDTPPLLPPQPHRGACSNDAGRYERLRREGFDDGWSHGGETCGSRRDKREDKQGKDKLGEDRREDPDDIPLPPLATREFIDHCRGALSRNDSPDIPFSLSLNPYRGCEHGCIYCYARPSHSWLGLSPGLDFETCLGRKDGIADLLREELRKPSYRCSPIAVGSNTDAWQPIERQHGLTRQVLSLLAGCRHPVTAFTKSSLIERDIDLLQRLAEDRLVAIGISLTTLDRDLALALEPRASPPAARLRTIRRLSSAGIPVAVLASPMIPALNDCELEDILAAAADAGAVMAETSLVRLPHELAGLFDQWLHQHRPQQAGKIWSLIRQSRSGKAYDSDFATRMSGSGPWAALLRQRLTVASRRLGLARPGQWPALRCDLFRPPVLPGDQMSLW